MKTKTLLLISVGIFFLIFTIIVFGFKIEPESELSPDVIAELESDLDLEKCAENFDKLYEEFLARPTTACALPTSDVQCEPESFVDIIRNHEEFNQSGCQLTYKNWAYLTENNDLVHGIYSPRYEFEMEKTNLDRFVPISIEKWGFDACDTFYLRIINHENRSEKLSLMEYENLCVDKPEQIQEQKFVYDLESVELPFGNYIVYLYDKNPGDIDDIENYKALTKFFFSSNFRTGPIIELDGIKQTNRSTLEITGRTNDIEQQIILNLYNPDGIFVTQDMLTPDSNGEFSTVLTTGGPLFKLSGHYKITLQQGDVVAPQINRIFDVRK